MDVEQLINLLKEKGRRVPFNLIRKHASPAEYVN